MSAEPAALSHSEGSHSTTLLPGSLPRKTRVKTESSLAKATPAAPAARKCPAQPTETVEER